MGLQERFESHWLGASILVAILASGVTWGALNQLLVRPRDEELARLQQRVAELERRAASDSPSTSLGGHPAGAPPVRQTDTQPKPTNSGGGPPDDSPPQPANLEDLAATLANERKTTVLALSTSVKGTIADDATKEHVFLGTANTPLLFTLEQPSRHFWATVDIYDSQGRAQLKNKGFVRSKDEISFTPPRDDAYILKLSGTRNFGEYLVFVSLLEEAGQ